MTREEHLLTILAEECNEVAVRASKALRFGVDEVEPGQPLTNAERINAEVIDLMAALEMLNDANMLPALSPRGMIPYQHLTAAKKAKVEKFLIYSGTLGTLTEPQ